MTHKPSKTAKIVKTVKKSAKALLSGKKDVKRLAAALPLTAILVEEVRAAQKTGLDVSSTPVQDAALTLGQDLALDETTDALDVQQGQVSNALLNDQMVVLPEDASSPVTLGERDLLLAQADTPSPASGGTISDAGAAGGGSGVGAGAGAPFELSAAPLAGAGIAPLAGALGLGAVAATSNTADGVAPKTYTFAIVKAKDNQGALQDDVLNNGATDDETPTLSGTADPGSVIQISEAGFIFGTAVTDANGNWSFTSPIKQAQGTHTFTATMAVDDVTVKTTTFKLTIDTFQPNAPAAPLVVEATNGGINTAEAANGTEVEVGLSGSNAVAGDKVTVTIDGVDTVYTLLAGDITAGKAMVAIAKSVLDAVGQGSASVTAFITDAAGNSSAVSAATTITMDTVAPNAPAASVLAENTSGGINFAEAANGTEVEVGLSGSNAVAGDKVTVTIDGVDTVYTLLAADITAGKAMVAIAKSVLDAAGQGAASVTAFITDAAGNSSAVSAATTITMDTVAPNAPAASVLAENTNGGINIAEAANGTEVEVGLSGSNAVAGDKVTVTIDGVDTVYTLLAADITAGKAMVTIAKSVLDAAGQGSASVTAFITDAAGNSSAVSAATTINIDTLTPEAPLLLTVNDNVGSATGVVSDKVITDDTLPTFQGTGAAGDTITIFDGATQLGTTQVLFDGTWTFTPTAVLSAGVHSITSQATDTAGNTGLASAAVEFVIGALSVTETQASAALVQGNSFAAADRVTLNQSDDNLSLSLKQLQKLGIDAVSVAGVLGDLSLDLGTGPALMAGALPVFGDSNNNGTLSAAEDAALNVSLNVDSLAQINELSSFSSGLAASGIDNVNLHVADQTALEAVFANSGFGTSFDSLIAAGLNTSIDMTNNLASLNAAQASNLIAEGLHFASNDVVGLQIHAGDATGTHLSTSLKELQKLGVDAVSVAAGGDTHVGLDLGNVSSFDAASFSGLPVFDNGLDVTLGVNSLDQLHGITNAAVEAALNSANIDSIQLNVADQAAFDSVWSSPANSSAFANDLASLHTAGLDVSALDVAGSFINAQIHLTELQAASLNTAGLHFAANDFVSMDVAAAQGTHLSTSMADLHKLGVDTLTITDGEHITDLGVMANSLTSHGISHLGLSSSDMANSTVTAGSTLAQKVGTFDWAHSGIDFALDVDSNVSTLVAMLENGVDVFNGQALSNTAKWGDLMGALHQSGLGNINLQNTATTSAASANVVVSDELTGALYDAGMLHALPDANITLDVGTNKVLQTSLKAMLDLGVDKVQTDHKVYVDLGLDSATAHDMQGLFAAFTHDSTVPTGGLFGGKEAGLVVDQTTFNTMGASDVHTLVQQLSKLGITEIDVLNNSHVVTHAYQITAQTQVLSQVDILGTSSTGTDLAVFDTDILNKTIKA